VSEAPSAPVPAAVIGCGRMGAFPSDRMRDHAPAAWFPLSHAEAIRATPGVTLAALCDRSPEALRRAADRYGVADCFTDHRDLPEGRVPLLAAIATRTPGRAGCMIDLAGRGTRAFHIEKPVCNSMAELERLQTLFDRGDVFVTLGALRRHFPIYRAARDHAAGGTLGTMLETQVELGRGQLFWAHPHSVDLLLFAAQGRAVRSVGARFDGVERKGARILNDPVVVDAVIEFEGGLVGRIGRMPGNDWRLGCERGKVEVLGNGAALRVARAEGDGFRLRESEEAIPPPGEAGGSAFAIRMLVACLAGNEAARAANAELKRDVATGQRVLFAMAQSHLEGGRPVTLGEIDPDLVIEGRTGELAA